MNDVKIGLFQPVLLMFTQEIEQLLTPDQIRVSFLRHLSGDWGDVSGKLWKAYDQALKEGLYVSSQFKSETGIEYWVVTNPGHKATMMTLPPGR